MKKLLLFAAVALVGLVSASPPDKPDNGPPEGRHHYPPCSRTVRDSCIQLNEGRHHRAREHVTARHQAARRGSAHAMRAPAAANRRLAHRVRRAGERG